MEEIYMKLYYQDQAFSFELLRAASYAGYQGAEIGECLATAARIKEGDFEGWFVEWEKTAKRVEKMGEDCLQRGHRISAREAFLRSHNYYRTAEFFLSPKDPKRNESYKKSVSTFQKAMELMDFHVEKVNIPYENTSLPGYFYRAADSDSSTVERPALIGIGGFDSTVEELYFCVAAPAIKRGYNCLIFDGPGQGAPLRLQNMTKRVDFEVPVSAAVDYLETRTDVDKEKIALIGMSMGGYYAPRAAAFEKRIKACIAYDVFYDLWEATVQRNPMLKQLEVLSAEEIEQVLKKAGQANSNLRWAIANSMWVFGLDKASKIPETLQQYSLKGIAQNISCPVLILAGESDHFVPLEQVDQFANELTCEKTIRIFTAEEGAEEHCQEGNHSLFHQVAFDWLDEVFQS
ncbi:alpha/beta hydrolase family protein [Brevibacillus massiliensis]|uniref:alpha/beta hydrolase family protein n=2 Tax=Brevibacillus massiliensis TaxID=1118054 RepID=UPI0021C372EA|nr:alpha/beta hydrolase [Brevibacillus massiliensis]